LQYNSQVPEVEWWDLPILNCNFNTYESILNDVGIKNIFGHNKSEIISQNYIKFDNINDFCTFQKVGDEEKD
jgi:hypothetical protein